MLNQVLRKEEIMKYYLFIDNKNFGYYYTDNMQDTSIYGVGVTLFSKEELDEEIKHIKDNFDYKNNTLLIYRYDEIDRVEKELKKKA